MALSHHHCAPLRKDQLQQDYDGAKAAQNLATRDFAALMRSKTGEGRSLQAPSGVLEVQVVIATVAMKNMHTSKTSSSYNNY